MRSEEILKDQILKYSVYQGLLPSAGWTNARSDRVVLVPTTSHSRQVKGCPHVWINQCGIDLKRKSNL